MDKRFVLALRYAEAGLDAQAWELVAELLAAPGVSPEVLRLGAALRLNAGAWDEALALADRAVAVGDPAAWHLKGRAHHLGGDLVSGEAALRAALAHGATAACWNDLGNVLADLGRPGAADAAFRQAIVIDPGFVLAHNNLGAVAASQGQFGVAVASYAEALRLQPGYQAARINLGVAQLERGDVVEAMRAFDAVLDQVPAAREAQDNRLYARLYSEQDPAAVAAAHRRWAEGFPPPAVKRIADPDPGRRLRIGYVSPDFRRHSVAFFLAPLIGARDPAAVEVFCYADVAAPDAVTEALRAQADRWRQVHGWSDAALAAQIAEDRIDILVDLAGHTQGNRLGLFAARAAPIQVSAIGYPATTGLAAMDYRLCDAITDPLDADDYASETPVRLVPGLHCYAPPPAPPVSSLPALAKGHLTLGSFNKLAKISAATVALWVNVLRALPNARLVIKAKALADGATQGLLLEKFTAAGIDPGRLTLSGWIPGDAGHLALYQDIDIALDTFPYNGTTTTCEALWMGVPVVTLAGRGHAARVSASLLAAVGLADWIAPTPEAFAARVVSAAADLPGLAGLRAGLREKMRRSPLCDARAHARGLEAAYRTIWRDKIRDSSAG